MNRRSLLFRYALSTAVALFMMTGCVEEFEADLPEAESRLLVVNGTICSNSSSVFNLTWTVPLSSEEYRDYYYDDSDYSYAVVEYVTDAKISICGTDGSVYECPEVRFPRGDWYYGDDEEYVDYEDWYAQYGSYFGTGVYTCDTPQLNPDVAYYVTIEYDGEVYQSTPEKPIRTPEIENLECFQKDSLSNIEVLISTAEPDNPDQTAYYTWSYFETWEVRPTRTTKIYFDVETRQKCDLKPDQLYPQRGWKFGQDEDILTASSAHYGGGKLSRYQLYELSQNDARVAWNYSTEVTQRAISKAEYEYTMACIQAGWEMGGLFSPQPSAMPSNIHCTTSSKRALGFVGCSLNTTTKRLLIDGTTIYRNLPQPGISKILDDCNEDDCCEMVEQGWVLFLWFDGRLVHNPLSTYWARPYDFDIRLQGVILDKPNYMP